MDELMTVLLKDYEPFQTKINKFERKVKKIYRRIVKKLRRIRPTIKNFVWQKL